MTAEGDPEAKKPVRAPRQVAIFGAGVAGLTAARELIERGYQVEVYEAEKPNPVQARLQGEVCAIGGVTRTFWASIPQSEEELDRVEAKPVPGIELEVIEFIEGSADISKHPNAKQMQGRIKQLADQLCAEGNKAVQVEVRGFMRTPGRRPTIGVDYADPKLKQRRPAGDRLDFQRALAVAKALVEAQVGPERVRVRAMGLGQAQDWTKPPESRDYVEFHIIQEVVPGERGFRFFPSYYRNLFDTMRRTPIADDRSAVYYQTPRTVLDNIVPAEGNAVGRADPAKSFEFRRQPVTSIEELFELMKAFLRGLAVTPADIAHHQLKLFKYMTSCRQRRAQEYEYQSWYDFMDADRFSEEFRKAFDVTGEITLAARASECDARSYGDSTVQLFLNQMAAGDRNTDGTLNGPTSVAWMNHWRRYLQAQGVRFFRGKLLGFKFFDGKPFPVVGLPGEPKAVPPPTPGSPPPKPDDLPVRRLLMRDYFVVAIPINKLREVVGNEPQLAGDDFERVRALDLGDVAIAKPTGMLRHLGGIQFFLATDGGFVHGHTNYIDSAWALSSIAQPQFWRSKRGWWDGYRGLLSVDIGNYHAPGEHCPGVWEATPDQVAEEVWNQIRATSDNKGALPESFLAYHLARVPGGQPRYLITRPGEYPMRPGRLDKENGYRVHFGNLVLAGTHMQTHARLTTMEAANESARHAVNGILSHDNFNGARCRIWDPEDHEPADLTLLKDLDRKLLGLGLPHLADILDLHEVPAAMLSAEPDLAQILQLAVPAPKGET